MLFVRRRIILVTGCINDIIENISKEIFSMEKVFAVISSILLILYAMLMLYFCCRTKAVVPDEIWFYNIAQSLKKKTFIEILKTPNELGYGSFYWITLVILNSFLNMRLFAWMCMMVIPLCIILVTKKMNGTWESSFLAIALFLSCPLAWFTGKIIGPELYGNALGALGCTSILLNDNKKCAKWAYLLGGVLIGISVGIKLYNMVFGLFIVIYEMWTDIEFKNLIIRIKLDSILKKGLTILFGCIIGFIATNSIVIWDTKAYLANMVNSKGLFSLTRMWHLLIDTGIQWDLVNSGGFCHSIVSLFGIICFFLIGCINRKKRRMVAATLLSFIVVTLLFTSTSVVLGWYYLPFLFILPLCMPDKIVYAIMLIVNFHFIGADTCYQIETKFQQIENVQNQIEIAKYIDEIYKGYNEYVRWNFIDVGLGEIATTKFEWNKFCSIQQDIDKEKIFMAVSERYRNNALINSFVIKAESNIDGYKLLEQQEEIYIIIHSPN